MYVQELAYNQSYSIFFRGKFTGILSAGINLACMRSSLELLEESKVPLLKGRSIHLPSHLYASNIITLSMV